MDGLPKIHTRVIWKRFFSSSLHLYGGENKFIKASRIAPPKLIGCNIYICTKITNDLLVGSEQSSLMAYLTVFLTFVAQK
jgi:hypothetical protein